jgi:hypothetical protein
VVDLPRGAVEAHKGFEDRGLSGGLGTQQTQMVGQMAKRALDGGEENHVEEASPSKESRETTTTTTTTFKKPAKVIHGTPTLAQAEKVLRRSGVMQDIINGV